MQTPVSDSVKVLFLSSLAALACTFLGTSPMAAQTIVKAKQAGSAPKGALKDGNLRLPVKHVLVLGIDGLHAFDLENYVQSHPESALAKLKKTGLDYVEAFTSKPSDSFPGILAVVTGGSPFSTGVYYETSYDRLLSPPGSKCASKGTEIALDESIDVNPDAIDGGGLEPQSSRSTAAGVACRFTRMTFCG